MKNKDIIYSRAHPFPSVSVVIPVLNSEKTLRVCLESVFSQDYPKSKYEVILVDGGSTDRTLEIAKRFPVRIVTELQRGRGRAYYRGLLEAKGEAIAFLDSDAYTEPSWLREVSIELMKDPLVAIVYCSSKAPSNASFLQKCIDALNYKGKGQANGVLYRYDAIRKTNGFDERLNYLQENELEYRILRMGYRIKYINKVLILHYPRENLKKYLKQNIEAGIGRVLLYKLTREFETLFYIIANSVAVLLPLLFLLYSVKYSIVALFILATMYMIYVSQVTNREYRRLKYILTVPFMNHLSIIGEFIGYLKSLTRASINLKIRKLKPKLS